MQIWQMKQEEVHAVAHKLLAADQVIHEQQLGWQWQGPDEDALLAGPHSSTQGARTLTGSKKKSSSQKASSEIGENEEMPEGLSVCHAKTRFSNSLTLLCNSWCVGQCADWQA